MEYDLVFQGGGAKGTVFVGALQEFTARGHTHGRLLGTSAGAITATLLAAGYGFEEMQTALLEKKGGKSVFSYFLGQPAPLPPDELENGAWSKLFQEIDLSLIPNAFGIEKQFDRFVLKIMDADPVGQHLLSFVERGGWYSADAFLAWLADKLDAAPPNGKPRGFGQLTLEEFYQATKKDLSVVAANTTRNIKLVLNHHTAPKVPVVWATRMSMSVPLLWQEVIWQTEWGTYRGMDISGDRVVDGGLLSNFPLELFISDEKTVVDVMGPKLNDNVLGLLIDDDIPVPNAPPLPQKKDFPITDFATVQRLLGLVNTMLQTNDKAVIADFEYLVARLPCGGYGVTEFDMTDARRDALIDSGRNAMKMYFARLAATSFDIGEAGPSPMDIANQMALKMLK